MLDRILLNRWVQRAGALLFLTGAALYVLRLVNAVGVWTLLIVLLLLVGVGLLLLPYATHEIRKAEQMQYGLVGVVSRRKRTIARLKNLYTEGLDFKELYEPRRQGRPMRASVEWPRISGRIHQWHYEIRTLVKAEAGTSYCFDNITPGGAYAPYWGPKQPEPEDIIPQVARDLECLRKIIRELEGKQ